MAYTIYVRDLMEHQRNFETLAAALKDEALELEAYGDPESATFAGDTATVIMSGEIEEVRQKMDGRTVRLI